MLKAKFMGLAWQVPHGLRKIASWWTDSECKRIVADDLEKETKKCVGLSTEAM
jgi:hypothetical protein